MSQMDLELDCMCADLQSGKLSKAEFNDQLELLLCNCETPDEAASLCMALSCITGTE